MRHLTVTFSPVDALNPDCGYSLHIIDRTRGTLLFTSRAPDDGSDLLTPADCLRVIAMYVDPQPAIAQATQS